MLGRIKKKITRVANQTLKSRKPLSYIPLIDDKIFLFIGGLHRSGTSILHRLLQEHPATSGFHDSGVLEDEGQHLQSIFKAAHEYGGPGEFAFHPEAHLTEESELINEKNKGLLLSQWGAYYDLGKKVLLEKSPPNLIRSRFLAKLFPNARFVFLVRHPIAVSLATEKWSDKTITEHLLHWMTAYSIMLEDVKQIPDCLVIRYEDLVQTPSKYLNEICMLTGIAPFSPDEKVLNYNDKYFNEWEKRYARDLPTLKSILPDDNNVFHYFGYTLDAPYVLETSAN